MGTINVRGSDRMSVEDRKKYAELAEAGPNDTVTITNHNDGLIEVEVEGPGEEGYHLLLLFDQMASRVSILWVGSPRYEFGSGWGTKKFQSLLCRWRQAGFHTAMASPASSSDEQVSYTGYYFWPKLGFVGEMSVEQADRIEQAAGIRIRSRRIEELFATPGGPAAWKKYGSTLYGLTYAL